MPKANINKVYDITLHKSLQQNCLHKVILTDILTYFVVTDDDEEEVEG